MSEFKPSPEQEEILARYREKKRKEQEALWSVNKSLPRVPLEVLQARYGGKNWGIETSQDKKVSDPQFSIIASRRLYEKEFEAAGYNTPENPLSASLALRKLIQDQNEIRKADAPIPD